MIWNGIVFFSGLFASVLVGILVLLTSRRRRISAAQNEADWLISQAQADLESQTEALNAQMEEYRLEELKKVEKDFDRLAKTNDEYRENLEEKEETFKENASTREELLRRKSQSLSSKTQRMNQEEERIRKLKERSRSLHQRYMDAVAQKLPVELEVLQEQVQQKLEEQARHHGAKLAEEIEEEAHVQAEREARRVLALVLNRFARAYCPERGIGNVDFPSENHRLKVFGKDGELLKHIEKICGVDVVYNQEYQSAAVMGFDPVRREIGRAVLEALTKDRHVDQKRIEDVHQRVKKDVFKRILSDGNRVAKELRLEGLHESIRSMLGALRYRYSFAQNQYFHVAEVGWLCGLLSAELGLPIKDGRRSGVLHDIGKAMDHSKEGGHAVIGAEFIEAHGERPHIVHAVRAHHYDETPATDLAFLTIAADAISGARPGARRSTMDSYTQKMADLEKIGRSFEGVTATYILSAGREVRVIVDGHRVDDQKALTLSQQIAQRIEEELSYPGLIKVTVVRETQAIEYAR